MRRASDPEMGATGLDSNDPLHVYLRELDTIQPMSRDEETALFQHLQNQDEQAEPATNRPN